MPLMQDEDGDIWETDAQGNPLRMVGKPGSAGTVIRKPEPAPKPQDPPSGYRWTANGGLEPIPGGPAIKPNAPPADAEAAKANIRAEAISKIKLARDLAKRSREKYFTTGFGSGIAGSIRGTNAYDLAQDTETIKNAGGLQRILEMSKANGGKNPLTPLSNTDFQALVNSLTNLDPGQSDEQYQKNLQVVEDLYSRLYEQAGGTDLAEALVDDVAPPATRATTGVQLSPQARGTAMGTTQSEIAKGGTEAIPVPEAMRAGLEGYLRGRRGTQVDKQDFAAFYNDLAKRNNYPGGTPESLDRYIRQFNESGVIGPITPAQKDIGALQQGYNWAAQTPVGTALLHGANASAGGLPELLGGQAVTEGLRELSSLNKPSAILGDVIGGVGGTLGLGKGLNIAGVAAPKALTLANLANSTMFGAASSPENRLAGGGIGFLAGAAGDLGGQYAVAPLAEAIGRKPVNAALAAMGRTPFPAAPRLSPAERMITNTVGDEGRAVTSMLGDASSLGLPMTLADTTEGLRSLGGAVARRSPVARNTARNVMEPRALGQIDRLQGALNRDIGPTANIPQRSEDLIAQARANAAPLYAQAYENPGASSVDLSGILKTDMGQRGLQNAGRRVSNRLDASGQPIDPRSMGFDFNDAGETVIGKTPSFQTLDQFKKGLDDIIEGGWDPVKASYSPDAQAAIGLKNHLVSQMDQVNPDYAAARAAYAGPASQREALNLGQKGISQPSDQIGVQLNGLPPSQQEQYRLGALSALSQKANSARFGTNPYETIYGSPEAQRRVQTLFPDANLGRFGRQYQLEGQMAQSRNQILGGSPTALNQRADQAFDVPVGATLAIDGASAMLAGAPPVATGARLLGGISKDAIKLGIGKKKAEALAPLLFSPDASTSAAAFVELTKNARRADVFKKATKRRRGLFGGLFGGATGAAATSGQQ